MKMKETIKKFITSDNEFSKRFTKSIRNFMFVHVGISLAGCIVLSFFSVDTTSIVCLLECMMPVYIALQGANYVKSGFENIKKISGSSKEEDNG